MAGSENNDQPDNSKINITKTLKQLIINEKQPKVHSQETDKIKHEFWETQPVPQFGEKEQTLINGPIEPNKNLEEIRKEPFTLPTGFYWDSLDINDENVLKELFNLLNENYVEDDESMFRFSYSADFLKWALCCPGWKRDWHLGVRISSNNKLIGFIGATPMKVSINDALVEMVKINFLCVHKKLRSKRVAPVFIKEITRRVNLTGVFQAIYTAGILIPSPISKCRYWHRLLNPKKLIDIKFSYLAKNMTMQRTLRLYRLNEEVKTPGFRIMSHSNKDIKAVTHLLNQDLKDHKLHEVFDEEKVRHWFVPRDKIVYSYVVEINDVITDFVSFFSLPSSVLNHPQYDMMEAAFSFYNVSTKTPLIDLMSDTLIMANKNRFDVFNALNLMKNTNEMFTELKFHVGDGNLNYYLFNWNCASLEPSDVAIVLQ